MGKKSYCGVQKTRIKQKSRIYKYTKLIRRTYEYCFFVRTVFSLRENICTKIGTSVMEGDFCSKAVEKEKEFDFITAKKTLQAVLVHEKIKNPFTHYSYSIEEITEAILEGKPNDIMIKELEPFYLITTYYHLKKNPLTTGKLILNIAGMTFSVKFIEEKGIRHFHSFTRN